MLPLEMHLWSRPKCRGKTVNWNKRKTNDQRKREPDTAIMFFHVSILIFNRQFVIFRWICFHVLQHIFSAAVHFIVDQIDSRQCQNLRLILVIIAKTICLPEGCFGLPIVCSCHKLHGNFRFVFSSIRFKTSRHKQSRGNYSRIDALHFRFYPNSW